MNNSRRLAIKNIAIIIGGISVLPGCFHNDENKLPLKNLSFTTSDETLLAEIQETILPKTNTPGSKDLALHLFTLKMMDDCYEKDKQQQFVKGLKEINSISKKKYGNAFIDCTIPQREEILMSIENKKDVSEDAAAFYSMAKDLTIRGYMTSKYVMTNLVKYELVPGRFHGSYPVTKKYQCLKFMGKTINTFDAIVIGSGMSGGWAAKELTEKGLKTLVLERGRDVKHLIDYPTTNMNPWEFEHRNQLTTDIKKANPVVSKCYAFREDAMHFFVKDKEHPYVQEKPFDWIRGYQVGGKSLMWARQTQRWSDFDFEGPARDGFAVDWPIRYKDLALWYSYVEKFAGISGNKDGIPTLPDGEFLPPLELTCVENYFKKVVSDKYKDRYVIYGRCAHLTKPNQIHLDQGRGQCQDRDLCQRGCPFGGYFSSNSSTIPWAAKTGNMTLRPFSVVHSIIYDEQKNKAAGVRVIDSHTKQSIDYYAPVIFVNAGALNTNLLFLNSTSHRFPNGFGNDSGILGKYVAFHNYGGHISAQYEGYKEFTTDGRRPTAAYIPRFRNIYKQETDFLRGYAAGFSSGRRKNQDSSGVGTDLKKRLTANNDYGPWQVGSHIMGETIPKENNHVRLSADKKDDWGIPQLVTSIDYDDNDRKMLKDFFEQMTEMYTTAGFENIQTSESHQAPGLDIHEMGGVRMGHDPKTSLLNNWNQVHACKNVFVTDGACMTSTSTQNPSLTYMAMTARAVDFAFSEMKKGNL